LSVNPPNLNDLLMMHTNGSSMQNFTPDKAVDKCCYAS